jgi:hypothetical protein
MLFGAGSAVTEKLAGAKLRLGCGGSNSIDEPLKRQLHEMKAVCLTCV